VDRSTKFCQDGLALRAIRASLKFFYGKTTGRVYNDNLIAKLDNGVTPHVQIAHSPDKAAPPFGRDPI